MTREQQRIAIAEACGRVQRPDGYWFPIGKDYGSAGIPDFLHDLNAMHDAERMLAKANWGSYAAELYRITDAHNHGISPNHHWLAVAFSTATQRAEAFLRTIGKWKESK